MSSPPNNDLNREFHKPLSPFMKMEQSDIVLFFG